LESRPDDLADLFGLTHQPAVVGYEIGTILFGRLENMTRIGIMFARLRVPLQKDLKPLNSRELIVIEPDLSGKQPTRHSVPNSARRVRMLCLLENAPWRSA
jgi:hypothetical protein